jgi:PAS domain S-box-containing protein
MTNQPKASEQVRNGLRFRMNRVPRKLSLLVVIFTVAVLAVAALIIGLLYRTALHQQADMLAEFADSQARTIETIARHEERFAGRLPDSLGHGNAFGSMLDQLRDANNRFEGFGRTGEFVLARRADDSIVFLLNQRHSGTARTQVIPLGGVSGEPMRRALSGRTGTVVGLDYRGVAVLAAYEPVNAYGLGVVAKVDLTEVQAPFVRAGLISVVAALGIVLLGSLLFFRITNPVLRRLAESEDRLRKLYAAMSEGLALHQVVYDDSGRATDYRVIDVNPAFESITGISTRQAVGALASQLYGTGSPPFLDVYARVAETGTPTSFEVEWPPMAKSFHISAFSFARGRFATVFTDVTERRRAEQKLQESEEMFRTLAQATPDHVMLLDAELRIRYANFAAPGLTVERLIGNPLPDFAPPGREAKIRALLEGVLETGVTTAYETVYEPPDGAAIYFESRAARLGGNRVVVVARDITERKRADERLRATMGELERSNADLEQFAYVASHDLQEPLRMIASYVGLLSERYRGRLDDRADRYVDYAVNGARRMQSLIDGLLDYARAGSKGRDAVAVDMAAAAAEAQANLGREIADANAAVEVGPLPVVPADRGQMVHVFQNLLSNAVKFHAENPPKVAVSARDIGQEWEFAVQDNGIGIDRKHSERVFGVFKRLHTAQEYPGTGIGLALCRKIVERHGGRIWLEPAAGGGSVFRFTLPKQPPTTFSPPAGKEAKEA